MYSKIDQLEIVVIGLGYVGLPVSMAFQKKYKVLGYDIDNKRIEELKQGFDSTNSFSKIELDQAFNLQFCAEIQSGTCPRAYLITVPTPIDQYKKPDLSFLFSACRVVANCLQPGDLVVFESTVYPGCTEEECIPILEQNSRLKVNIDFFAGYSPERINPGDTDHSFEEIVKVTSGSNETSMQMVDELYASIIKAGTYRAPSIKVAEAAKLIENCQRDLNISFMNELALVFDRMGLNTTEVLAAAATKWNFLNFHPGLVGGHCISVDPYYMIHKAESLGYFPELIGAGRKINEQMPVFIVSKCIKQMVKHGLKIAGAKALILGISYKTDCSDIRNSKVPEIKAELEEYAILVDVHDPLVDKERVKQTFGIELTEDFEMRDYQLVILAVPHQVVVHRLKNEELRADQYLFDIRRI